MGVSTVEFPINASNENCNYDLTMKVIRISSNYYMKIFLSNINQTTQPYLNFRITGV